ncbi:MAG TPA: SRPBCC domain-containing protein [Pseudonocardia sp.]|nr:SRPBCC domain-containing protein [Pseudonocardia sp.]
MVEVLERSYERTVRIKAPQRTLYGEMDSVEALARFLPQVDGLEPDPDPRIAVCFGAVAIGPLSYRLKGTLELERVDPPNGLWLRLRASNVPMELEGRFEFTASAAEETTLRYSATIRSEHKLIRRMRSSMIGVLEEHVDAATDLAAVRGRQYAQAARLLSPDMNPQDTDG